MAKKSTQDGGEPDAKEHTNLAERVIETVSEAAERVGDLGQTVIEGVQETIHEGVDRVTARFRPAEAPSLAGQPLPEDVRPVRPRKGTEMWLAWRKDRWVPVYREQGVGWVWSE